MPQFTFDENMVALLQLSRGLAYGVPNYHLVPLRDGLVFAIVFFPRLFGCQVETDELAALLCSFQFRVADESNELRVIEIRYAGCVGVCPTRLLYCAQS